MLDWFMKLKMPHFLKNRTQYEDFCYFITLLAFTCYLITSKPLTFIIILFPRSSSWSARVDVLPRPKLRVLFVLPCDFMTHLLMQLIHKLPLGAASISPQIKMTIPSSLYLRLWHLFFSSSVLYCWNFALSMHSA